MMNPAGKRTKVLPEDLVKAIRHLASVSSEHEDLVTLYIPPDRSPVDVIEELKKEYDRCGLHQGKNECAGIKKSLVSIITRLKAYETTPPHGFAIFCGSPDPTNDPESCVFITPPSRVTDFLLRYSKVFDTEPLVAMRFQKNLYGLILIDSNQASWGLMAGGQLLSTAGITSNVPARQRKGGQSALRFQRLREIAIHEFFVRAGEHASADLLSGTRNGKNLNGLIIGGRGPARDEFAQGKFLRDELRQKCIGVVEIADVSVKGLHELAAKAETVIGRLLLEEETRILQEFFGKLAGNPGRVVYGEARVREPLTAGAVQTLILSSALRTARTQITCTECGHRDEITFRLEPGERVSDILTHTCRVCASPIIEDPETDTIEDLTRIASLSGARSVVIHEETDEGGTFFARCGGIGAILRYREGVKSP